MCQGVVTSNIQTINVFPKSVIENSSFHFFLNQASVSKRLQHSYWGMSASSLTYWQIANKPGNNCQILKITLSFLPKSSELTSSLADYSHERGVATSFSKKQAVCNFLAVSCWLAWV